MEAIVNSFKQYLQTSIKEPYGDLGFFQTIILWIIAGCVVLITEYIGNKRRNQDDRTKAFENFFNKADLNNDGVISEFEAVMFFRGFGLPDNVINEIWHYADENQTGELSRPEFFKALRLVTVAQGNQALTPDVVKSALFGPDAAKIPPPKIMPSGPPLPVTSQRPSSSSRYAALDPKDTASGENRVKMEFNRRENLHQKEIEIMHRRDDATANRLQREIEQLRLKNQNEIKKIHMIADAMANSHRREIEQLKLEKQKEIETIHIIAEAKANYYQREIEQLRFENQKEIKNIHMIADAKASYYQRELEQLMLDNKKEIENKLLIADAKANCHLKEIEQQRLENQRLRNKLFGFQSYCGKLKQERNDAIKMADELCNQKEFYIYSDKFLSSQYSSNELKQATENFSDSLKIGEGGFGCVYKGSLRKTTVAIKKLNSESLQGLPQFQQEIAILSKVRHPHIVNLIGSCSEISALVYEFMPNGSLEDRLVHKNDTPSLTWQTRIRIVSEMCLALVFIQSSKPYLVIHGDLKPDNILLDANFTTKLSDFGNSCIIKQPDTDITACHRITHLVGTFAYIDPELSSTGELTPKSDVYSFGIIVLRLLTGKPALKIVSVVQEAMQSGGFQSIIDGSAGKWPMRLAEELAELGLRCAETLRKNRPDMIQVWETIEPLVKVASQSPEFSTNGSAFGEEHIPLHFICPISREIMKDPCIAADGFTYEAEAIKMWFNTGHNTSPMTNMMLPHLDLIPNLVLRSAIQEWQEHHTRI